MPTASTTSTASMRPMTVGDYLRISYLVTAQSVVRDDGTWVRHVEHPELPDCVAEADSITEALRLLEIRRIQVVLDLLADGRTPPARAQRLGPTQARLRVERAGFGERVGALWDKGPESGRGSP